MTRARGQESKTEDDAGIDRDRDHAGLRSAGRAPRGKPTVPQALAVAAKWVSVSPSAIAYGKRGINRVPTGDLAGGQSDYKASSTRPKT